MLAPSSSSCCLWGAASKQDAPLPGAWAGAWHALCGTKAQRRGRGGARLAHVLPWVRAKLGAQPWTGEGTRRGTPGPPALSGPEPRTLCSEVIQVGLCPRSRAPAEGRSEGGGVLEQCTQRWAAGNSWGEPGRGRGPTGGNGAVGVAGGGLLLGILEGQSGWQHGRGQRRLHREKGAEVETGGGGPGKEGDEEAREACRRGFWPVKCHLPSTAGRRLGAGVWNWGSLQTQSETAGGQTGSSRDWGHLEAWGKGCRFGCRVESGTGQPR